MSRVPFCLFTRHNYIYNLNYRMRIRISTYVVGGVLCLFLFSFVVGCVNDSSFTRNKADALPNLQKTQNPTPIDPTNHVYGPTNKLAFGQIYRPTTEINPKTPPEQSETSNGPN